MPRILFGTSLLLLTLSFIFGLLNGNKVNGLRNELAGAISSSESASRARIASEKKLKARENEFAAATSKTAVAEAKASDAEAELAKAQNEKGELESKLRASENQIADLQKRIAEAAVDGGAPEAPGEFRPNDIQAQLDDVRRQLEATEREKSLLADKAKAAQDRVASLEEEKKRSVSGAHAAGIHGTVLAVNQAYNFVVLSMGDRQGVVPNSEMLVMRHGALIGKIRVSSVEPTTSIGDILTNSLARGVQVQPGDTVIYAGSNNS